MSWQTIEKINPENIVDSKSLSPLQYLICKEALGKAFEEMSKLPRRDVRIIMLRDYEGRTLEETRQHIVNVKTGMPISRERVRQIGDRALCKIRETLVDGGYGLE